MPTTRQGMSSTDIEQIVAQRVTNAIEAIVVYETKIHMAHDSIDQIVMRAYTARPDNKNGYAGKLPLCNKLSSFEVIIRKDWLSKYHTVIICDENFVRISFRWHVFLAHITEKKAEDKSEEKKLEDVSIVRDFPEVFPEDLPGLPPS
ncbi:hypothetical protein Tco_0996042 [Tanacetum coccineum]